MTPQAEKESMDTLPPVDVLLVTEAISELSPSALIPKSRVSVDPILGP